MRRLFRELRRSLASSLAIAAMNVTPKGDKATLVAFYSLFEAMAAQSDLDPPATSLPKPKSWECDYGRVVVRVQQLPAFFPTPTGSDDQAWLNAVSPIGRAESVFAKPSDNPPFESA
ncbi:hypothetical protein [Ensifer canadensis]